MSATDVAARAPVGTYSRATLEGMIDTYLAALAANDPSRLPVSKDVSFVENYQPLALGEGTWRTITGLGTYKHYFADTGAGQAGFIGSVRENGRGAVIDIRLKLDGDKISEIETFIIRDALFCSRVEEMGAPEAVWLESVPADQRLPRDVLAAQVNKYFESMQRNDGMGDYSFFDRECNRLEHGLQTTNLKDPTAYGHSHDTSFATKSAEEQWKSGFLGFVTEIHSRRFVVIDEERQAVLAFATFDHNGTIRVLPLQPEGEFVLPPYFDVPRTLNVMEAFKLKGDKLYRIEMTLTELPYGIRPPQVRRAERLGGTSGPVDEAVLRAQLSKTLAAMKAHDASGLPLAKGVRYFEDGQTLDVGDGLWGTLTAYAGADKTGAQDVAVPQYEIVMAEPSRGEIAWIGGIVEHTTPGMLTLRLRMDGAEIVEIEAVAVRLEEIGERGGTVSLFQPRLLTQFRPEPFAKTDWALTTPAGKAASRAELTAIVERYFDGVEQDTSKGVPFAADCARRDNGMKTAGNADAPPLDPGQPAYRPFAMGCAEQIDAGLYKRIGKVRERRHLVVDAARGLVLSVAVFDNPAQVKSFEVPGVGTVLLPGMPRPETEAPAEAAQTDILFGNMAQANVAVPVSELVVQLTKIEDGKIVAIETLVRGGPFGMSSGVA